MSIDSCNFCGASVDTDYDDEAYQPDPRMSLKLIRTSASANTAATRKSAMRSNRWHGKRQHMKNYSGSFTALVATGILLAIAAIGLAIWAASIALGTDNATPRSVSCLTKEQARAKWPNELIYWHTAHHCWDNVQGTANTASMADGTVKIIRAP